MRRKAAPKRPVLIDPIYKSELVAHFVNHVMRCGKKSLAEKIVYGAFLKMKARIDNGRVEDDEEGGSDGQRQFILRAFENVLDRVRPEVELKARRVGGATYQVPIEVVGERGIALAMRWIVESSKSRHERGMMLRLAGELADAYEGRGNSVKKREDMHRMAEANKAFSHYRF